MIFYYSISTEQSSIFGLLFLRGSHGLSARRARRTKLRGAKDEAKRTEGPPPRSRGPDGPWTSSAIHVILYGDTILKVALVKGSARNLGD